MRFRGQLREEWRRWAWVCPLLALALAVGVLSIWGLTLWTAIGVALFLVCPAIIIWAMLYFGRDEARDKLLVDYRKKRDS